ncbi:MAG: zf-HC2 domain-containing protein [Solirubrobacteraceae bacterium]
MSAEDSRMDPGLCGDNAAPYVLGALTDEEHEAFRGHLESCAVCREEVAALQVVALAWLRWRPQLVSGALAAAAVVAVIVIATSSGGGAGTRVIRAEVIPRGADASLQLSDGRAQLEISGMPQTPPQRVYEVWIKRSGSPQPTDALFTVTSHGDATVGVPGSVSGVKVIMVTSEPLGGTKVPTTSPVIIARLG